MKTKLKEEIISDIHSKLNDSMIESCEPLIQKALEDIEKRMRQQVAAFCIATIQSHMMIETFGTDIRITLKGMDK